MQKKVALAQFGGLHASLGVFLVVGGSAGLGGTRLVLGGSMLPGGGKPAPRASPKCRGWGVGVWEPPAASTIPGCRQGAHWLFSPDMSSLASVVSTGR